MQCPHCNSDINTEKSRIFFCPYCQSILDDELMYKSLPSADKNGLHIEEYLPDKLKIAEHGSFRWNMTKSCRGKVSGKTKTILITLFLILCTVACVLIKEYIAASIVGTFAGIGGVFCFVPARPNKSESDVLFGGEYVPIRYYGNEHVFGYAAIAPDSNDSDCLPHIHFVEVYKKEIVGVEYDDDTNCHFVEFDKEVDIGGGDRQFYTEIPYIFDESLFDMMYGEHTA